MNIQLKVKIHTLTSEAIYIRRLQRRLVRSKARIKQNAKTSAPWMSLQDHRRQVVRREARASFLAYGFLRGRPITVVEQKCKTIPDWKNVERIVSRFTTELDKRIVNQKFEQWKQLINLEKHDGKTLRIHKDRSKDPSKNRSQNQATEHTSGEASVSPESPGIQG